MVSHRVERPGLPGERRSSACIAILPLGSADVDGAGRPGGADPLDRVVSPLAGGGYWVAAASVIAWQHLGRIRSAEEEGDGRVVDRRAHRGRGRLVEVQLHELGLAATRRGRP